MHTLLKVTSAILFMFFVAGSVQAELSVQCTIPNGVTCDITDHQNLIKNVVVTSDTPFGLINVVDQDFPCVSTATVTWDSAYYPEDYIVTYCGIQVPKGVQGYQIEGNTVYDINLKGVLEKSTARLPIPQRDGLTYAAILKTKLLRLNVNGVRKQSLLQRKTAYSGVLSTGASGLEAIYYCCNEGTTQGCFKVDALAQCGAGLDFLACNDNSENCTAYPN